MDHLAGAGSVGPHRHLLPTTSLCAIVNGSGVSMGSRRAGHGPSRQTLDPGGELDAVSCPPTSFCLAADAAAR